MKNHHIRLLSLLLALLILLPAASLAETRVYIANPVPTDRLNLREAPSKDAPVLAKYYNGAPVVMLEERNDWAEVIVGCAPNPDRGWLGIQTGWMHKNYLVCDGDYNSRIPAKAMPSAFVFQPLVLYSEPDWLSTKQWIPAATEIYVMGVGEDWWHVLVPLSNGSSASISGFIPTTCLSGLDAMRGGREEDRHKLAFISNPNRKSRLNLRATPSAGGKSIGQYYNGPAVVKGFSTDGQWVRVSVYGREGWMMRKFLFLEGDGQNPTHTADITARVTAASARLYEKLGGSKACTFPSGTEMEVLGVIDGETLHVRISGMLGFISRKDTDYKDPSSGGSSSQDSSPQSTAPASSAWNGPTGYHATAEWPFRLNEYTAAVNNPNPADRLHLRTEPKRSAKSLGKYYNGVRVIVNGSVDGGWTKVRIGELEGYMKNEYLVFRSEGKPCPASAMPILYVSSKAGLDLYAEQSQKSNLLGHYRDGTPVILMGFTDKWAHVIVDNMMGFMLTKYLK